MLPGNGWISLSPWYVTNRGGNRDIAVPLELTASGDNGYNPGMVKRLIRDQIRDECQTLGSRSISKLVPVLAAPHTDLPFSKRRQLTTRQCQAPPPWYDQQVPRDCASSFLGPNLMVDQ